MEEASLRRSIRPMLQARRLIFALSVGISIWVLGSFAGTMVDPAHSGFWTASLMWALLTSLLLSPALLVAADAGARLALNPAQVPVGIVTGLLGGPYFLYLMRKHGGFGGFR